MKFDTDNKIVQLCAQGMQLEGEGKPGEAKQLFVQAWEAASNNVEKFTAAHYVARQQETVADKLHWDTIALTCALQIKDDDTIKETYASLYLNIGKCYEDLRNLNEAKNNYEQALLYAAWLPDDGYGNMIKSGIQKGIARVYIP